MKTQDVLQLANDHPGVRGLRQLKTALDLYDSAAASPKETWLRLLAIRAGYPRPTTQIPVWDPLDRRWYYLDLGWDDRQIAMEYEGDQHRTDPAQFAKDVRRYEKVAGTWLEGDPGGRGGSASGHPQSPAARLGIADWPHRLCAQIVISTQIAISQQSRRQVD